MTLTLEKIRNVIDLIDEEILALLAERLELARGTPSLKENIQDMIREEAILANVRRAAQERGCLRTEFVEQIYSKILAESCRIQKERKQ